MTPTPCKHHPNYTAEKPPLSGCGLCWRYWHFVQKAKKP